MRYVLKEHNFHNRMSTTCGSLVDCHLPERQDTFSLSGGEIVRPLTADCVSLKKFLIIKMYYLRIVFIIL
jgi:hypothetical protein